MGQYLGIDREPFQSFWMKYGHECEPNAISKYEEQAGSVVPFLACSPDGLVDEFGLIEIKSLKFFKDNAIRNVTESLPKEVINRQCFYIKDRKCILKRNHEYYYQVQMQFLVTERKYCDFILYAENGPVSVERIERDEQLIQEILQLLTAFWKRLIEMRVPRNLMPIVLPDIENAPHNTKVTSDTRNECSHTKNEMDVADCLINSSKNVSACPSSYTSANEDENPPTVNNLAVFPMGWINK